MIYTDKYNELLTEVTGKASLVAVSKTKPKEDILELYTLGQRDFAENYVQELADKQELLPKDIRWHFIGHLQSNKVKFIAPFVSLIHSVDSLKLLKEIDKQATKNNRIIDCLLQVHIASEETKFGLDETELIKLLQSEELPLLRNITIRGLMGMATFTADQNKIRNEFKFLKLFFDNCYRQNNLNSFSILSMGMSADYRIAIEEGSNLVRIGSLLFGERS